MKYYTTVAYMNGHNKKIDELNSWLRDYQDILINSEEGRMKILERTKEFVKYLNITYPRCKEFDIYSQVGLTNMIIVRCVTTGEQSASILFHEIKREI